MCVVPASWRRDIGELLIGSLSGTTITPEIRSLAREFSLGGVIFFARNIEAAEQVAELSHDVQSLSNGMPLWVSVDQEGGRVARLKEPFTVWPPMATLGRRGDEELAGRFAAALAAELRAVGITLDYAPVLDIHTNERNPVIGDRALSTDADMVARLGVAIIRGLQEHGVAHQLLRFLAPHNRRRHAGKGGELIHHAADIADLPDNGFDALGEDVRIARDFLAVFALQALGGQLDGCQRILDLMRDAPRHIGPGRGALRRNEIGNVIESHDEAMSLFARFARHLNVQMAKRAVTPHIHLARSAAIGLRERAPDQTGQFGNALGIMQAFDLFGHGIEEPRGRAVDERDSTVAIKSEHTG